MIIIDAHQDIAYNAVCFGRDYLLAALWKRQLEAGTQVPKNNGHATSGLPEAIAGRVAIVFATIFVAPRSKHPAPWSAVMYETPREAHTLGRTQLDYYHRLTDNTDKVRLIHTLEDLDSVLKTWGADYPVTARQQGLVLLMENADPILEPKQLEAWVEQGLRIIGPAWSASRYCGGTGIPGGMTKLGIDLLNTMMDFNLLLDLSHMAEQAFFEALDIYTGSVIASHSNPRKFCDTDRHLSDTMIRRLAEHDGVMGIVPYNRFLKQTWGKGSRKATVPFATLLEVIDYICQLTGSSAHVGIGTDFDGGFGAESIPDEMDTIADVWTLGERLLARGYGVDDVEAIMGGNMHRKLREVLK